jgi:hypothetical protein
VPLETLTGFVVLVSHPNRFQISAPSKSNQSAGKGQERETYKGKLRGWWLTVRQMVGLQCRLTRRQRLGTAPVLAHRLAWRTPPIGKCGPLGTSASMF